MALLALEAGIPADARLVSSARARASGNDAAPEDRRRREGASASDFLSTTSDLKRSGLQVNKGARTTKKRSKARLILAVVGTMMMLGAGCTVIESRQYQVDLVAFGYHAHLYKKPTMMLWIHHSIAKPNGCGWDNDCTWRKVESEANLNGVLAGLAGANTLFDDDSADFAEAFGAIPHPWPLSINLPEQYGCLGAYKQTIPVVLIPLGDGDWYADQPNESWCKMGEMP